MPESTQTVSDSTRQTKTSRRTFLLWSIFGLLSAFLASAVGVVIRYLIPPSKGMKEKELSVPITQVPLGASLNLEFNGTPVILIHTEKGFSAFNATCTHLGCLVKWVRTDQFFLCPCHAGKFDQNGKVLAGPPPEPLKKINIQVKADTIIFV